MMEIDVKKSLRALVVALSATVAMPLSANALTIDPIAGASGGVDFDLGDTTVSFEGDSTLDFTLAGPSILNITVDDCCVVGDIFDLIVDGSLVAWGSETFTGGLFQGSITGLVLGAGSHTIDFGLREYCCDTAQGGFATYEISGQTSVVPVPAALPLLASGLGLIGLVARRRRKKAVT
jgi:hypothetical protein